MSWSRNWPKNVVPAVWLGLLGLLALSDRSTISCFGPGRERVVGVEQAAGLAQLAQRRLDRRALLRERRQPEDPPEVLGRQEPAPARRGAASAPASPPRRRD